jgi:hypothetical protein
MYLKKIIILIATFSMLIGCNGLKTSFRKELGTLNAISNSYDSVTNQGTLNAESTKSSASTPKPDYIPSANRTYVSLVSCEITNDSQTALKLVQALLQAYSIQGEVGLRNVYSEYTQFCVLDGEPIDPEKLKSNATLEFEKNGEEYITHSSRHFETLSNGSSSTMMPQWKIRGVISKQKLSSANNLEKAEIAIDKIDYKKTAKIAPKFDISKCTLIGMGFTMQGAIDTNQGEINLGNQMRSIFEKVAIIQHGSLEKLKSYNESNNDLVAFGKTWRTLNHTDKMTEVSSCMKLLKVNK